MTAKDSPTAVTAGGNDFFIVALGASAGGLAALEEFFAHMSPVSGLGFVIVTHQHLGQASMLADLIGRKTEMPTLQVSTPTRVEPNHIYTIKPGYNAAIREGVLQPFERDDHPGIQLPIDFFLRSLALDQKSRAIAIILSGSGSDGSVGLKEIKGELGMVMVQEEGDAGHTGMPHSAVATGLVDFVLAVKDMPTALAAYVRDTVPGGVERRALVDELPRILTLIRDRTGHDFSEYKPSTIGRRIERRMTLQRLDTPASYVRFLHSHAEEIDRLFKELLIGVTSFFRDRPAWDALVPLLSQLLASKPDEYTFRVWVPGCSTGEEAYSLAILLREYMDANESAPKAQIFATDIDAQAIGVARAGAYPQGIANDLSAERLARFFVHQDSGYRVKKSLRELIVFSEQDLVSDPPFTKLDLISCRNVLIYMESSLQQRLLPMFHYALRPKGLLFLGSSESIGSSAALLPALDKKWRLFQRSDLPGSYAAVRNSPGFYGTTSLGRRGSTTPANVARVVEDMLLDELVPPTLLVREAGDVVHIHGHTGAFLEPAQGSPLSANIFNMVRAGLQLPLSVALRQAAGPDGHAVQHGTLVENESSRATEVRIDVARLRKPEALADLFRVSFSLVSSENFAGADSPKPISAAISSDAHIADLEQVVQQTRNSHRGTIEQLESAHDELKSTNEELQSVNEELETSKEEMQSLNEELQTVNVELQGKVEELSRANDDMKNLLDGTDIATIFLDTDLKIKRFTAPAVRVIRLLPSDLGRSIGDLRPSLHYDKMVQDAREVLTTLETREVEVLSADGVLYLMRILPYRTVDNLIDGVVITFVDITGAKLLRDAQQQMMDILAPTPVSIFFQDHLLRFTEVVGSFLGIEEAEVVGKTPIEVLGAVDGSTFSAQLEPVLRTGRRRTSRIRLKVAEVPRSYNLYLSPRLGESGQPLGVAGVSVELFDDEDGQG